MSRQMDQCQILVIGAGPAGIAAAYEAAQGGTKVIMVDRNPQPGGQIWRGGPQVAKEGTAQLWFRKLTDSRVKTYSGAEVIYSPAPQRLVMEQGSNLLDISFETLILATGARERFIPFPGWTLPGVMGAGGLQALVKGGLSVRGKRIVVAGSGPLLLPVAATLKEKGAKILLIAEQTSTRKLANFSLGLLGHPKKLLQGINLKKKLLGIPYRTGSYPITAMGEGKLQQLRLKEKNHVRELDCDLLACGFHLVPNLELPQLFSCEIKNEQVVINAYGESSQANIFCVGEITGIGGVEVALLEGRIAGLMASGKAGQAEKLLPQLNKQRKFAEAMNQAFALDEKLKNLPEEDTIICRCEDVTHGQLRSKSNWREAKLQTRCGMGPCQGRTCGAAATFLYGWEVKSGRPPVFPAKMKSLVCESPKDSK